MTGTNVNVRKAPSRHRKEWNEYAPEMIEAIRRGYLDDQLAQIAYEIGVRQSLVKRFGYYMTPRNGRKRR